MILNTHWIYKKEEPRPTYYGLSIISLQDGSTVSLTEIGSWGTKTHPTLQYSLDDGSTWTTWTVGTSLMLDKGEWICVRGTDNVATAKSASIYTNIAGTGQLELYGSFLSM